jgi:hypothetical protein
MAQHDQYAQNPNNRSVEQGSSIERTDDQSYFGSFYMRGLDESNQYLNDQNYQNQPMANDPNANPLLDDNMIGLGMDGEHIEDEIFEDGVNQFSDNSDNFETSNAEDMILLNPGREIFEGGYNSFQPTPPPNAYDHHP